MGRGTGEKTGEDGRRKEREHGEQGASRERAGGERSDQRTGEITETDTETNELTERERKREVEIEQSDHTIGNVVRWCDGALYDAYQHSPNIVPT